DGGAAATLVHLMARDHAMNIVLAPDGPLHAGATLARYHLWGEDPANRLADGALLRVLRCRGGLLPYEVRVTGAVDDARLAVRIPGVRDAATGEAVAAEVRRIFGFPFDLSGFYRLAKSDPVLAELVEPLYGMRPTLAPTPLDAGGVDQRAASQPPVCVRVPRATRAPVRDAREGRPRHGLGVPRSRDPGACGAERIPLDEVFAPQGRIHPRPRARRRRRSARPRRAGGGAERDGDRAAHP